MAPDASGKLRGGFNFNQRTTGSFVAEQYAGAKGILDTLPTVAAWRNHTPGGKGAWEPYDSPEERELWAHVREV